MPTTDRTFQALQDAFDAWQTARVRRAYTSVSAKASDEDGFAGMVGEMRAGLRELDADERAQADERVLEKVFLGGIAVHGLRFAWRGSARLVEVAMTRLSPVALNFLVGKIEVDGPRDNLIPSCRFRQAGGEALCERVCRRPSEDFAKRRAVPVRLEPQPDGVSCRWRWGAS